MTAVPVLRNYIAGTFTDSADLLDVTNPATGALLARAPRSTQGDVDRAIAAAHGARQAWARRPAIERAQYLRRVASRIRDNATRIARTLTEEQGKISSLAAVEVAFTADYMDYMAEWARRIEGEIITSDRPDEQILLLRKPMGVVVGILPWNFPFFLIARKMAPALVTGNTLVIKPSEETPINCHLFTELLAQCELPPGVFNVVYGQGTTGAAMASHAGVDMISFTGSVATGERIAAAAAPYITKLNLELGGKAPPSCWPMPTWHWPSMPFAARASSTPARYATASSASMWSGRWPTNSSPAWPRPWPPPATAIRSGATTRWRWGP